MSDYNVKKCFYRSLCAILAVIALFVRVAHAEDMTCQRAYHPSTAWNYTTCTFAHPSKFVPGNADWDYPGAFLLSSTPPHDYSLLMRAHFNGYSADQTKCANWDTPKVGQVVTKNCADHYPDLSYFPGTFTSWGGARNGEDAMGWRISGLFSYAFAHWTDSIDWGAGVTLEGPSEGGTTAILQSMMLPNEFWREQISVVQANVPQTLFMNLSDPLGGYWRDPAVQAAWGGYDWRKADILQQWPTVQHVYYRINGSPADGTVVFDLNFFHAICDDHRIACFGTWGAQGHDLAEPGINLPFTDTYSGPDSQARLDTVLPIFTHSSANLYGPRGHYNLGLEWNSRAIVDAVDTLVVPIRYRQHTNIGGDVPDQPASAIFTLTLRRPQYFALTKGQWIQYTIGAVTGYANVKKDGEVTIGTVQLDSSDTYTNLTINKIDPEGC
jgi:hypothetical protein